MLPMIIRRKHNGNFTVIGNEPMNDERLSAEALGVLCYLRSRPDNWNVIPDQLADRFSCGRNRMYRILKELIDGSYITRTQKQDQSTKTWQASEYIVYDEQSKPTTASDPHTQNRDTEPRPQKPYTEKPHTQNRDTLISTDSKQAPTAEQKIIWPSDSAEQFWEAYPRKIGKQSALKVLSRLKKNPPIGWSSFLEAVGKFRAWAATKDIQYVKHPATWLNAGCWDDELTTGEFSNGHRGPRPFQDDSKSASRAAGRLAEAARRGEFSFAPRPSLLPRKSEDDVFLLPKG